MKNHGLRRIFSLFLALFMVFTLLPTAAFAEDTTEPKAVVVDEGQQEPKQEEVKLPEGETPEEPKDEGKQPEGEAPQEPVKAEVPANENNGIATQALNTGHKIDVTFTVLYVGDEFRIGYNYGSSDKTQFVCQYTTNHSDTAYNNHTIAISDIKAAAGRASVNSGYQIVGWSKESNANPTTWSLNKSGTTACNKGTTIYLVAKKTTPSAPSKPTEAQIVALQPVVRVTCTNDGSRHGGYDYSLEAGTITYISDVTGTNGVYTCTVTVKSDVYVEKFVAYKSMPHTPASESKTFELKYNTDTGKWAVSGTPAVTFNVACLQKPPKGDVERYLKKVVKVQCTTSSANHPAKQYDLIDGSYSMEVKWDETNGYTCDISVSPYQYVTDYNETYGEHTYTNENKIITLQYGKDSKTWGLKSGNPTVFFVECDTTPDKPSAPTDDTAVFVKCTADSTHTQQKYALIDGTYSIGEVVSDGRGGYTCDITITDTTPYVTKFNEKYAGHTYAADGSSLTFTMTYQGDNLWVHYGYASINVKCEPVVPTPPDKPTKETVEELLEGAVTIVCRNTSVNHDPISLKLADGEYEIGNVEEVTGSDGSYYCNITVKPAKYVDAYSKLPDINRDHVLAPSDQPNGTIKLLYDSEIGWYVDRATAPVNYTVMCTAEAEAPPAPTNDEIKKATAAVKCTTGHGDLSWKLRDGTFTPGEVTGDDTTGYTCIITVRAAEYVKYFNENKQANGITHTLADDAEKTFTMTYKDGEWTRPTNPAVTFEVKCEEELVPVRLVIYRNGDTSKAYKTVSLESQPKGHVIDLTTLNIGDYYTANYTGKYDFYGWYNDGTWNVYKKNLANPPAGLSEIKVNGWTNIIGMVYDYEKVVYFQSAEALKAYQNDHSKTEGLLYSTTVRKGDTLPTADAPTATRTGYTFKFWSREGQNGDVTGQTVNGWTNLYAVWEKNTYTVTYTDGVNGEAFTDQVYTAKYEDATPAFEGTPARAGYKFLGWEPKVAETVTENATYVAQWEKLYTVTYTDGVGGNAFKDDVHSDLEKDTPTPAFSGGTPTRKGFVFDGWNPEVAETVTEDVTYTAQWKPVQPDKKAIEGAIGRGVAVVCDNQNVNHGEKKYKPTLGEYTVSDVMGTAADGYTCTITVKAAKFIDKYNSDMKGAVHTLIAGEPAEKTIELKWNGEKWVAETELPVTFHTLCPPEQPSKKDIEGAIGRGVKIVCDNQNVNHWGKDYKPTQGEYTVSDVTGTASEGYTCTITVKAAKIIEKYSSDMGKTHELIVGEQAEKTVELKWDGEKWVAKTELPITFHVECPPEKPTYEELKELGINAKVDCTTTTAHNDKSYTLIEGTYDISDPARKGTAYTCILTVNAKDYVAKYNAEEKVGPHTLDDRDSKTIELTWNGEKWTATETSVTFNVKCELLTVTYTDGVKGEEVFADIVYKDIPYGTDTPAFGTKDPTREGYKFVGWDPEVAETVTGNATYTAKWEKLYTVTYTDGVKGAAFKDQVYKDLESGTATPKFNGTPKRSGYTFTGWSPKVTDTVTKDVTYVAQWKSTKNGKDNVPKTGDSEVVMVLGSVLLFSFCGATAVYVFDRKRKQG